MRLLQALLVMVALAAGPVRATELVADLSQHQINISTGFSGTELLLFGAADPGGDVVVIVSGPEGKAIVRKKTRVSGIWINTESVAFDAVPAFYHVSATSRLSNAALEKVLAETGIGLRYQNMSPSEDIGPDRAEAFRNALRRRKEVKQLYSAQTGKIEFVGGTLFRAKVPFPATVPTGNYRVDVYQVEDGWVKSVTTIPLAVGKVGMEEKIFRFAHEWPTLYGIFAIVIAALAGYGAGMLFGRR